MQCLPYTRSVSLCRFHCSGIPPAPLFDHHSTGLPDGSHCPPHPALPGHASARRHRCRTPVTHPNLSTAPECLLLLREPNPPDSADSSRAGETPADILLSRYSESRLFHPSAAALPPMYPGRFLYTACSGLLQSNQ